MDHQNPLVEEVAERIRDLELAPAIFTIKDKLLFPSNHTKAYLAAKYKAAHPQVSLDDIFKCFEYEPGPLKSVLSSINDYHHVMKGDRGRRVSFGYPHIDQVVRGIRPGQVCGVMARAGVGKTTLALNIIVNQFRSADPCPTLFFSLEMPAPEIAARLFSIDQEVWPSKVEEVFEQSISHPRVSSFAAKYADLVIVDEGGLDLGALEHFYNEASLYLDTHIPLVVIDYLGLITGKGSSSYERASNVALSLKSYAKKCNCAVLVLIQASRAGGTGKERVDMSMARDSGQIEEACDFLLGAWRPDLGENTSSSDFKVSILKNRHGVMRDFDMTFDSNFLRIEEGG